MKYKLVILFLFTLTGCVVYKPYPVYIHNTPNAVYITNIIEVCDQKKQIVLFRENIDHMAISTDVYTNKPYYYTNWFENFPRPNQNDYNKPFSGRIDKEFERE